jgi:alpha-ketoglutaric semialdehyde dehydrogenase
MGRLSGPTALLLVDAQEDFLGRAGLTPDRATLVATLGALLEHARKSGWSVVHVHTRVDADLSNAMPHRRDAPEVVAGTAGAEPPAELQPVDGELVLFKRFFSAFDSPDLEPLLRSTEASRLIVAGVHTHACIRDTVQDAYRLGFEAIVPREAVGSYDPAHAAATLEWLDGRSATVVSRADLVPGDAVPARWAHFDPCDSRRLLFEVGLTAPAQVRELADRLTAHQVALEAIGLDARIERLSLWRDRLRERTDEIRSLLISDLAKPVHDADGELGYGMALLDETVERLPGVWRESGASFAGRGLIGLITPWNNPFAIPVGKIAPALACGNAVVWKPALAASRLSALLAETLADSGFGDWVAMVTGDAATGEAIVSNEAVQAISFTGSVPVGRRLIARAGLRDATPFVQAELGGSNAAIVDASCDLDFAAADLAAAMFSYAGQRCTAIRRIIVLDEIADDFVQRLLAATRALKVGMPDDPKTDIGPLINRTARASLMDGVAGAVEDGGRLLCGGTVPDSLPVDGCWMEPTLVAGLDPAHRLNQQEWFGPVASILTAPDFDQALAIHNDSAYGLLGALYSTDEARIERFAARAQAGILSIGRARPPFSSAGPFLGWKSSGFGVPEHGRWNVDFYTRAQAVYRA